MNNKTSAIILFILITMSLTGCAGYNVLTDRPDSNGDVAGFFMGIWHGATILFAFIGSLFSDNISIYEVYNNGGWYNFGYLIGISLFGAPIIITIFGS